MNLNYRNINGLILKNKLFDSATKIKNKCIKNGNLNNIIIKSRIGSESVYGETFKACYPMNCEYNIAIKKIPLKNKDSKYIDNYESVEALNNSVLWSELFFLKLTNTLVYNKICPNLPLVYGVYKCNDCEFQNKNILKHNSIKECLLIPNELADGDLKNLINQNDNMLNTIDMMIIYFQIFMGIYCIKKYYGIYHNDLHWGNVLFQKLKNRDDNITYKVVDKEITIPTNGYLMILWDFGLSFIPEKINSIHTHKKYQHVDDFIRITNMLQKKYKQLYIQLITIIYNSVKLDDIIKNYIELLSHYININETKNIIQKYNTNKSIFSVDKTIHDYILKHDKNPILYKNKQKRTPIELPIFMYTDTRKFSRMFKLKKITTSNIDSKKQSDMDFESKKKSAMDINSNNKSAMNIESKKKSATNIESKKKSDMDIDTDTKKKSDMDIESKKKSAMNIESKKKSDMDMDVDTKKKSNMDIDTDTKKKSDMDIESKNQKFLNINVNKVQMVL